MEHNKETQSQEIDRKKRRIEKQNTYIIQWWSFALVALLQ